MKKNCLNPDCKQNNPQPIENFNKNKSKKDGLQNWCKSCFSEYSKEYSKTKKGKSVRQTAKEKYRQTLKGKETTKEYNSKYYQDHKKPKPKFPLSNSKDNIKLRKYFSTEKGKLARARYNDNPKNKMKLKARAAVNNATRDGILPYISTKKCHICNKQAHHYHHHKGYEKKYWLDVLPICRKCHFAIG